VGKNKLSVLPDTEDLLPEIQLDDIDSEQVTDNRNIVDDNTSQALTPRELKKLREEGVHGSQIIQSLIQNSSTFESKTEFSKAKWLIRKHKKYLPRCRIVRCTGRAICEAQYWKDARKIMNLRDDTLGQMLSYANICAGRQVLVFDTVMGIVSGTLAQRMGGYGKIISLYTGQQPAFLDMLERFNLNFAEHHSIKWIHTEDIFVHTLGEYPEEEDLEATDRDTLQWPCPLQDHTRAYLETVTDEKELDDFFTKRCNRFARKLTRTSPMESRKMLLARPSDSVLIATKNDPTETLLGMLPHLGPSCPFVVFFEYIEPLAKCFLELQKNNLAINLRLTDTWMREYQVLPGRTHPNMHMSQNGGFLLTGIKLNPSTGVNIMEESLRREIREQMATRRGKRKLATLDHSDENNKKSTQR
jgi:tRNA (adenine-N(1)-)-methyltransferase non-catalytic subunit